MSPLSACAATVPAGVYKPRRPQASPLFRLVSDHFRAFHAAYEGRFAATYGDWRPAVREVADKLLARGVLEHGFARVRCGACTHEYLLAFSCKARYFCPSCHAKRLEAFHRRLKELYLPPERSFTLVDVPEIRFAVIDGKGNPDSTASAGAVRWLYAVVHLIKPLVKKRMGRNFVEPPLECLCWADDPNDFVRGNKDAWKWRVMIAFVDWISREQFDEAVAKVVRKRGPAPATLRLESLHEGKSVQIMHVGDYNGIAAVGDKLYNEYLPEHDLKPTGTTTKST